MNGEAGGLVCKTIGAAFFVLNVHITPVQKLCQELSFLCILSAMSLGETVRRSVLEQRGVCTILAAGHLIVPSNRDRKSVSRLLPPLVCPLNVVLEQRNLALTIGNPALQSDNLFASLDISEELNISLYVVVKRLKRSDRGCIGSLFTPSLSVIPSIPFRSRLGDLLFLSQWHLIDWCACSNRRTKC